jgi:hypothetical protein
VLPIIGVTFGYVLEKSGSFRQGQGAIDWLNKVINESILGSTLIRLRIRSSTNIRNSLPRTPKPRQSA